MHLTPEEFVDAAEGLLSRGPLAVTSNDASACGGRCRC